jgi:hypothetical protein
MTNRKKVQIQEANIILERRYLMEQAAAPTPSGTTTPPPSGTTTPVTTTTTTVKKMTQTDLDKLRDCSGFNSKKLPGLSSGTTQDDYVIYNLQGKPFCKDNIK